MAIHSSILAWEIPRTGSPWAYKELDETERLSAHTHTCVHRHTHVYTHPCLMFVWPWEKFMALNPGFLLWNVILTLHEAARVVQDDICKLTGVKSKSDRLYLFVEPSTCSDSPRRQKLLKAFLFLGLCEPSRPDGNPGSKCPSSNQFL